MFSNVLYLPGAGRQTEYMFLFIKRGKCLYLCYILCRVALVLPSPLTLGLSIMLAV